MCFLSLVVGRALTPLIFSTFSNALIFVFFATFVSVGGAGAAGPREGRYRGQRQVWGGGREAGDAGPTSGRTFQGVSGVGGVGGVLLPGAIVNRTKFCQ